MTTADEPSLGRVFDAITRTEMKVDFLREERTADKAALEQRLAADKTALEQRLASDKESRAADKLAQQKINESHATELQTLRDAQQQRKGISSMGALIFGTVGGAVVAFGLGLLVTLVTHKSTPATPQTQTNCGTFVVVGSTCPSATEKTPTSPKSSALTPDVGQRQVLTAIHRPIPQQPFPRVAVGQQKALVNPKAKVKKPTSAKPKKGHKK